MTANADYCSYTGKRVHSYFGMEYWKGHDHPTCQLCGYVDASRHIPSAMPVHDPNAPIIGIRRVSSVSFPVHFL